jgi:hypothetical protein
MMMVIMMMMVVVVVGWKWLNSGGGSGGGSGCCHGECRLVLVHFLITVLVLTHVVVVAVTIFVIFSSWSRSLDLCRSMLKISHRVSVIFK